MNIIISKQLTKTKCIHAPATPVLECSNPTSALSTGTSLLTFEKIKYIDLTINPTVAGIRNKTITIN